MREKRREAKTGELQTVFPHYRKKWRMMMLDKKGKNEGGYAKDASRLAPFCLRRGPRYLEEEKKRIRSERESSWLI